MKTNNRLTIILLLSLWSNITIGQFSLKDSINFEEKEVFVLGTMHFSQHNFQSYPQNINREIENAIKFNPEMVCVEWIHKSEELDLYNYDYSKLIHHLEVELEITKEIANARIDSLYRLVRINPEKLKYRAELANYLFISRDYINACYQWFIIQNSGLDSSEMEKYIPSQIERYKKRLFEKRNGSLRNHEIIEIAFPVAWKLGHEKVYSIDYMHERSEYGKHIMAYNKRLKQELDYSPTDPIHEYINEISINWLERNNININSSYLGFLNSEEYRKILFKYYYSLFLRVGSDPDYSKWYELQLEKRNWKMYELLINSIRETNAQRTFVLVGLTHKYFLERYLKESGFFKTWDYKRIEAL